METISALLDLCAGNSPVTGEFTAQRPVMRIFDVSFDIRLIKRLSKQMWGWWFETPSRSLWRYHIGCLCPWQFYLNHGFRRPFCSSPNVLTNCTVQLKRIWQYLRHRGHFCNPRCAKKISERKHTRVGHLASSCSHGQCQTTLLTPLPRILETLMKY